MQQWAAAWLIMSWLLTGPVRATAANEQGERWQAILLARQRAGRRCIPVAGPDGNLEMNTKNPSADCYMDMSTLSLKEAWYGLRLCFQLKYSFRDASDLIVNWSQASQPHASTVLAFLQERAALGTEEKDKVVTESELYLMMPPLNEVNRGWHRLLLARQRVPDCYMAQEAKMTLEMNPDDPNATCYMNLAPLEHLDAKADGLNYRFQLTWTLDDDSVVDLVWVQTSHPAHDDITGFEPISADAVQAHAAELCSQFRGLGKSSSMDWSCTIDGNGKIGCWWNCAGSTAGFHTVYIPGPLGRLAKAFELHVLTLREISPQIVSEPVLLVQQTSADCYMDPSVKETFKMNPDDPTAKCYMNLDPLEDADAKFDGVSFLFMTKWVLDDDNLVDVLWSQTSHPTQGTITGFKALNDVAETQHKQTGCGYFTGIGKTPQSECVMDGNGEADCYWNCVGSVRPYPANTQYMAAMVRHAKQVELHLLKTPSSYISYDSDWHHTLLARQSSTDCLMDPSVKETFEINPSEPARTCFMNLAPLEDLDAKADSMSFLFKLKWTLEDATQMSVVWTQTSHPAAKLTQGFQAANVAASQEYYKQGCSRFVGLSRSSASQCVMDGTMEDGCSQSCLGSVDIDPQNISRLMAGPGTLAMYVELHLLTRYPLGQGHIWNEHILAKQSWRDCLFDEHAKSTFEMNPSEPDEKCYMNLAPLDDPEARADGVSFRLKLMWVLEDNSIVDVIWMQTSHVRDPQITGFQPVNVNAARARDVGSSCVNFFGLGASESTKCVIDGTGNGACRWNCVGTLVDAMHGPLTQHVKSVELYVLTTSVIAAF